MKGKNYLLNKYINSFNMFTEVYNLKKKYIYWERRKYKLVKKLYASAKANKILYSIL